MYSLDADPTENTASNNPSTAVTCGCLEIARVLLTFLPAVTKQRMFLLAVVAYLWYHTLKYLRIIKTPLAEYAASNESKR
jgi:hypothetical protein